MKYDKLLCLSFLIIILLSSCSLKNRQVFSVSERSLHIDKKNCFYESISPSKSIKTIIQFSGDSPNSQDLNIDKDQILRLYWNQESTDGFTIKIKRIDTETEIDSEKEILIESSMTPSSGCNDIQLKSGDYKVSVENNNNQWTLLIDEIVYK